jgi:RNA polymerase sigma-70 factor (ECF subfamily)
LHQKIGYFRMSSVFSNRATLEDFRRGDPKVLTQVYNAFMPTVARLARFGFGFRGYAMDYEQLDLIQETFVRAFSEPARIAYNGISPYEAYLVGIAKNIVIDQFRRRAARIRAFDFGPTNQVDEGQTSASAPEAQLDLVRLHRVVNAFVENLPRLEQRFVNLRFVDGQSQEQVAKSMKLGRNRVRTLERRFRQALYRELRSKGWTRNDSADVLNSSLSMVLI